MVTMLGVSLAVVVAALGQGTRTGRAGLVSPSLSTAPSPPSAAVGGVPLSDSATITGAQSTPMPGTVTFNLYGPSDSSCTATPVYTSAAAATTSVNGTYNSGGFDTSRSLAGVYHWIASYSGDVVNGSAKGSCSDEPVSVTPAMTTQASGTPGSGGGTPSVQVNTPFNDTATLSGASPAPANNPNPATIIFKLYGPNDATCASTPITFPPVTVNAPNENGTYTSGSYTPTKTGTYQWVASYSGDANNPGPVTGTCGDPGESVQVTPPPPPSPTMTTQAQPVPQGGGTPTANPGDTITDTATISNAQPPPSTSPATITFTLYGPNDPTCSTPITPAPAPVTAVTSGSPRTENGTYTSPGYQATAPGVYRWIASFSGDANNGPVSGKCNDANEAVNVGSIPTLAQQAGPVPAAAGTRIGDTATLAGASKPTGIITFALYGPDDPACSRNPASSSINSVSGNGSFTAVPYTANVVGLYDWVVSYSGDANNAAVSTACGDPKGTMVVGTPTELFVNRAYLDLLLRPADLGGLRYWAGLIDNNGVPQSAIASAFTVATEYRQRAVDALYQHYLHRDATTDESNAAVKFISQGGTYEQIIAFLTSLQEYFKLTGTDPNACAGGPVPEPNKSVQGFVDAVYCDVLNRTADPNGEAYWMSQLGATPTDQQRSAVATAFSVSTEYYALLVEEDYNLLLRREPDSPGWSFWVQQFQSGTRDEAMVANFVGSHEYWVWANHNP